METLPLWTTFYYWDKLLPGSDLVLISSPDKFSGNTSLLGLFPCGEPKGDNESRLSQYKCCTKQAEDIFAERMKPLQQTETACIEADTVQNDCISECVDPECIADCASNRNTTRPTTEECTENDKKMNDLEKARDTDYKECKRLYDPIQKPTGKYREIAPPLGPDGKLRNAPPWVNPSGEQSSPRRVREL